MGEKILGGYDHFLGEGVILGEKKIGRGCVGAHGRWFKVKHLQFSISTIIYQNLFLYSKVRFKYHYPPL